MVLVLFLQATAEQIRLAQMISHNSDADFEEKVKQVRWGHWSRAVLSFDLKAQNHKVMYSLCNLIMGFYNGVFDLYIEFLHW